MKHTVSYMQHIRASIICAVFFTDPITSWHDWVLCEESILFVTCSQSIHPLNEFTVHCFCVPGFYSSMNVIAYLMVTSDTPMYMYVIKSSPLCHMTSQTLPTSSHTMCHMTSQTLPISPHTVSHDLIDLPTSPHTMLPQHLC